MTQPSTCDECGLPIAECNRRALLPLENAKKTAKEIPSWTVQRGQDSIKCECGGFCDRVNVTEDEATKYGCGRDTPGHECCARAFVCAICGTRYVGQAEPPEME